MKIKIDFEKIISIVAVIFWMGVIFSFSTQNGKQSGNLSGEVIQWIVKIFNPDFETLSADKQATIISGWQFFVRKAAHFSEYAVLGMLTANSVRLYTQKTWLKLILPMIFSALYSVSDEIHQFFVPERACSIRDMALDTAGAVTGVLIFTCFYALIRKIRNSKHKTR